MGCQVLATSCGKGIFLDMVFLRTQGSGNAGTCREKGSRSLISFSSLLHPVQLLASLYLHPYWLKIICGDICESDGMRFQSPGMGRAGAKEGTTAAEALHYPCFAVLQSRRRNGLWSSRV